MTRAVDIEGRGVRVSGRSVDVGSAIPDSDVYLHDDWEDNKLQNRDGSGTTTHNGIDGVYRPEWNIQNGSPSASNGQINITTGDRLYADVNINLNEPLTLEVTNINHSGGSSDQLAIGIFTEQVQDISFGQYHSSYNLLIRNNGDSVALMKRTDGGSFGEMVGFLNDVGTPSNYTVTRSPSGDWELFADGQSLGTATDTEYTNPQFYHITTRESASGTIDEIKLR